MFPFYRSRYSSIDRPCLYEVTWF